MATCKRTRRYKISVNLGQLTDINRERKTGYNMRLAKKRVQCLNEVLCFVSSSVLADSLVLRNPLLRQAPNRYARAYERNKIYFENI